MNKVVLLACIALQIQNISAAAFSENSSEYRQRYPLHRAVTNGDMKTVECLLKEKGCDPKAPDCFGNSLIGLAIRKGRLEVLDTLIKHVQHVCSNSMLFEAIKDDQDDLAQYLLDKENTVDTGDSIDLEDAITQAREQKKHAIWEKLLTYASSELLQDTSFVQENMAAAIKENKIGIVEFFAQHSTLKGGPRPNFYLKIAVAHGRKNMVEKLLNHQETSPDGRVWQLKSQLSLTQEPIIDLAEKSLATERTQAVRENRYPRVKDYETVIALLQQHGATIK